jgi:P-type Mg2+ transporter
VTAASPFGKAWSSPEDRPAVTVSAAARHTGGPPGIAAAAVRSGHDVLRELDSSVDKGLSGDEVVRRQARYGPNAVSSHRARLLPVLWHQLRSPLLGLLLAAALVSYVVGEQGSAVIVGVIVGLSVALGFVNEYRAEKAAEALNSEIHHDTLVVRDGRPTTVDVTALVPGDVVELKLGEVVPADVRLLRVTGLECDESVLTGESLPVDKTTAAVPEGTPLAELSGCALMGTVVHAGGGRGVVVSSGSATESAVSRPGWARTSSRPASRSACAASPCCSCTWPAR